jgi:hypothetical protein
MRDERLDREIGDGHWGLIRLPECIVADVLTDVTREERPRADRTERYIEFALPGIDVHPVVATR